MGIELVTSLLLQNQLILKSIDIKLWVLLIPPLYIDDSTRGSANVGSGQV